MEIIAYLVNHLVLHALIDLMYTHVHHANMDTTWFNRSLLAITDVLLIVFHVLVKILALCVKLVTHYLRTAETIFNAFYVFPHAGNVQLINPVFA